MSPSRGKSRASSASSRSRQARRKPGAKRPAARKRPGGGRPRASGARSLARWVKWGVILTILGAFVFAAGFGFALLRLEETLSVRNWDLPARLYPAPLILEVGSRLPPGPLGETLEAMGYHNHRPVQKPGEYRKVRSGQYYLRPRGGWPGLEGVVEKTLDVRVRDHRVVALREYRGRELSRVTIPPVAFAEIRGPDHESRRLVHADQIPEHLANAVVAIEDRRFYQHHGVDPRGIVRALLVNLWQGERAQGGSTLTQQLAKNYFLTQEKTYSRKIRELFFALALEYKFTKKEILAMYLNEVYLGQRGAMAICGVGQAAHFYFTKRVGDLELHEAALLAGLIQAPNFYAPDRHKDRARKRRNLVLQAMFDQGFIDADTLKRATEKPLGLHFAPYLATRTAPYFVDLVTEQLGKIFPGRPLHAEGFIVETSLDLRVQRAAEHALQQGLDSLDARTRPPLEGALVALEPTSGRILAMVGGRDYGRSQFNRAVLGARQPGSAFKPLLVLAALQSSGSSLDPTSRLDDSPLMLRVAGKKWSPRNSDRRFRGEVTLRQTIEQSINVPAVRLALDTGLEQVVDFYKRLELKHLPKPVPSLALGAFEVSPLELAAAYTPIADQGFFARPIAVTRVLDREGHLLYSAQPIRHRVATLPQVYMVRDMMKGVLDHGTGKAARSLGYPFEAAGKTGTTNDSRDAWFVGLDTELLAVVWVGADSGASTGLSGARGALPIWTHFMKAVRRQFPPPRDPVPEGLTRVTVCSLSLEPATEHCPETREELFWQDHVPIRPCSLHGTVKDEIGAVMDRLRNRLRGWFRRQQPPESDTTPAHRAP